MKPAERSRFAELIGDPVGPSCTALMGGGGKSTLLQVLGEELAERGRNVLLTSLTRMHIELRDQSISPEDVAQRGMRSCLAEMNPLYLFDHRTEENKLRGISEELLQVLCPEFDATVFECDGARNLPIKAHNERDPVVPAFATGVLVVVGADAVGTRVADGLVHRPALFCSAWDVSPHQRLDVDFITEVVTSRRGYRAKIQTEVPVHYFVNKANLFREEAAELAASIGRTTGSPTWYGSLHEGWLERVP